MNLERILGSRTRAGLLALLLPEPERSVGLREAARLVGVSPNAVQHEAGNLVDLGILRDERVGTSRRFRADASHPLYADLRAIVLKTASVGSVLREALAGVSDISAAFIYGSVACGTDDARSDIDLMVIGEVDPTLVYAAARVVQDSVKRPVRPSVFTESELEDRMTRGDAFIVGVLAGPKIVLLGSIDGPGTAGEAGARPP
ncbi:MAG: DNA polymerase subunit beta [Coriobacteriaceae bacterium]|nr:DNA polymerase subunit beta [Coriobacteriaceae bacterium]